MKHYLIIGGSKGIGSGIVDQLKDQNQITVLSRTPSISHTNVNHIAFDANSDDISSITLPEALDGVVYCPGTINLRPFRSLKPEDFLHDFNVNVIGAIKVLKALQRPLKQSEGISSVVLFSTVAVGQGMPFHTSVASAKGAVEGLTRSLAAEWAPHIRVNCVAPSLTDTPLAEKLLSSEDKKLAAGQRHPLKRVGEIADVAAAATYLLSEQSSWITGQVLPVDGGMSRLRV